MVKSDNEKNTGTKKNNPFAGRGYKNTKSRKAIVGILQKSEIPMSAEQIYLDIKNTGGSTNLSTVYRTLERLEQKHFVIKTHVGDGKARYELTREGHRHHLICTNCYKMVPIEHCPLEELQKDLGSKTNFDITGHRLELYGICPNCKNVDG